MRALRLAVVLLPVALVAGAAPALSSTQAPLRHLDPAAIGALPKDPVLYAQQKAVANARYANWAQLHHIAASPYTAVSGALNHSGLDASYTGDRSVTATPPDTTGAIGPSNYVEMVNSEIAVYSSSDLSAAPTKADQATFFNDPTVSTCDGQIQWDQEGQRWLYAGLYCPNPFTDPGGDQRLYFGFSKGTSPLPLSSSNWCRYQIATGSNLEDYPKLGHDDTQILIGTNEFTSDGFGDYDGSNVYVLPKPAAGTISTCPTNTTETTSDPVTLSLPGAFTPVPVNLADASTDGYAVATDDVSTGATGTSLYLYDITAGVQSGSMSPTTTVTVPSYRLPASVPQPGTSDVIDSLDGRLTQAVAVTDPNTNKEGIWTQHTIAGNQNGPSVVRWYELTPGDTTPTQVGTVHGLSNAFAFNGAISPSADGNNAALFYNSGSSSQLPDFRVGDRHSATASGTMIEDLQLAQSSFEDSDFSCPSWYPEPCRWGDYAGASPDPSNSNLVWGTGELTTFAPDLDTGNSQWGTQNAAIDVSPAANYTLDVTATDVRAATGSVASGDTNIDCPGTCSYAYAYGTPVELTATPDAHSIVTWSGGCTGTGTTCDLPMGGPQSVTATFSPQQEGLSYTKTGSGSGAVTSNPAGLTCSNSCSRIFDYGSSVELTATPSAGSSFAGWSGADCTVVNGKCDVSMNQARSATATFTLIPENLTVSKAGVGSGTVTSTNVAGINCGATCSHDFNYPTRVTLHAAPATGSNFTGWSGGGCSGTADCTVSMTAAKAVTATFGLIQEVLTVSKSGTGSGTVTGTGISCGATCSHTFNYGTSVTLTATPDAHVTFDGWSGACSGTGTCVVSMTAASSVSASFTAILCEVPGVKGKTLSAAKGAIQDANCSVGSVTKKFSKKVKKGRVISQSPGSGSENAFGSPVKLVVSKGKKKK